MININGTEYPTLCRWSSIEAFCVAKGVDLNGWIEFITECSNIKPERQLPIISDMVLFIFICLDKGAAKEGKKLDLTRDDVYDWFMEGNRGVIVDLLKEANGLFSKNLKAPQKEEQI